MGKKNVGGQAVIEGVYMRGESGCGTAVRLESGKIKASFDNKVPLNKRKGLWSKPFIRGVAGLIDSMVEGISKLNYSASFFEEVEAESKFEKWLEDKFGDKLNSVISVVTIIFSVFISLGLFMFIPTALANVFKKFGVESTIVLNLIEGLIRISIFFLYIILISKLDDIKRLFQYHGAEHKTIFAYEKGLELTPANAKKQSRFHPRCGTNFMFLVMVVSILLFSFTGWGSAFERLFWRIVLLPVVAGTTYEIIRWLGNSDSKLSNILAYPGLQFQRLTTREPDEKMLEVAIIALKLAEGIITVSDVENMYKENSDEEIFPIEMKEAVGGKNEN